ncbi:phosphopantothenoylcysteine decarboxylase [Streptomyces sp. NBC_00249]|uniref:flavoprotein n=1 Tax=Streptomyces sp. NBC_00249 TaxID=2975690 RepID=UPI00224EBABB|nr:flavoprotein [Streptomyces sp. NBC_00249]MCX5195983.1 phosphopantothenoylcysteine decarboxylase [Streptomyces sp. NBC_00249]
MDRPDPAFRRVLVVGTGALGVAFLPFWINWLRNAHPETELRVALTRSALRFVSADAISVLSGTEVFVDDWSTVSGTGVPHVELARWADLVLVHPATLHFVGRYALGITDTPLMLALQSTEALVGVAPSLPPAAHLNPVVRGHLDVLRSRPGVVLAPTVPAVSASTGELEDGGSAPLNELYELCAARAGAGSTGDPT